MFQKILIANRGEIAFRIIRACRELGVATVAVYSEVDRNALHVRHADEAYDIGGAPATESYLNIPRIIEAAQKSGAQAIHPGYGFLAENAEFAQACIDAGLTFIGPSPQAIRAFGDKVSARRLMRQAGVPVVPGSEEVTSNEGAASLATRIGYPILVKAAAGGGGKGMRTVYRPEELPTALESARQEAASAFGHGSLYLEKFLEPVRHIEVQIIADYFGNVVAIGERECSIQRRHQKLIEEAPSLAITGRMRSRLAKLSVEAVKTLGYTSLGTLEFLLDESGNINFLEMNTRLQVEHPVTELITGMDLVADQIRVAAGEELRYKQSDVHINGWAIECRIAAEDPFNNFLPSVGTVQLMSVPGGPGVRLDSALYDGMEVSIYYDPMIAKLCTWGRDRNEAIVRMRRALREFKIVGVHTNIPFHLQVLENPYFLAGRLDTAFVEKHFRPSSSNGLQEERVALLGAAVLVHLRGNRPATGPAANQPQATRWRSQGRAAAVDARAARRGPWRKST
ncbi:MAG TPA: acetyl-CoA carboxylase biotin carboxylase subunit [Dehalococcoidia bacterium]|nr:acetyl-CoA carboxylase biotin carboxylase subunit [Dehalococcoidia bacterium]